MVMEGYYSAAFAGFDEDVAFYEGTLDEFIEVPEGFEVTIPTTARAVVDEAVDNVNPADVIVFYPARNKTQTAATDADTIRRWSRGLWKHWRKRGNDIDIVRDFLKNLFMSGKACFKVAPDWYLWPQLDEKVEQALMEKGGKEEVLERVKTIERIRSENLPIFCRSISPSCIMEDPTVGVRKLWVIERYHSSIAEVRNTYAIDMPELRDYYSGTFPIHEVWTATYIDWNGNLVKGKHMVFVNWEVVRDEENPYDELPYVIKYSGFGREAYEGRPEFKAVGFYTRQNKSMFLAEMRRHTQFDAIMQQSAFSVAFLPDSVDQEHIDFSPGAVNFVSDDVMAVTDKIWIKPKLPDAEYLSSLQMIGNQIERGTVQRALRGAGVPGTDSAAQYGMIGAQAKLRIESAKQACEEAMSTVTELALKYTDLVFKADLSVFVGEELADSYRIGPSNIRGRYGISIQFQPNEDAIKERKLVLANDAIAKGGLSRWDAYTFAGFENPWELIERKNADDLMQEPMIKRALAKRALKAWGEDADQLELEERIEEAKLQQALSQVAQQMQVGTPAGGDPMSQNGDPANANGVPPALGGGAPPPPAGGMPPSPMGAPGGAPSGGDGGQGMFAMPGGAPAAAQQAPVAGMMRDIRSLGHA
jgi:hypothetical protein